MKTMLLSIKLEPNAEITTGETNLKQTPFHFEVDGNSTIGEIKELIQNSIDVRVERQEIRTMSQTLADEEILANIDELNKREDSTVMLYIKGSGTADEEQVFSCSLLCCSIDEAADQQDHEMQISDINYLANYEPPSVTSTITAVDDNEAECVHTFVDSHSPLSYSSNSSDDGSGSESSGSETETSHLMVESRKHHLHVDEKNAKWKRAKRYTVLRKLPCNISLYLDELSTNPNEIACSEGVNSAGKRNTSETDTTPSTTTVACSPIFTDATNRVTDAQTNSPTSTSRDEEPCANIAPEQRKLILILSNIRDKKIEQKDCAELLATFFDVFEKSQNIEELKFYNSGPILWKGLLWIACEDEPTFAWTQSKSNYISDIYESHKFVDYFKLQSCITVIPRLDKAKNLLDVFALIEQQNPGIKTAQWAVLDHRIILNSNDEFYDKRVSFLCPNEVLFLRVDESTLDSLKKHNLKLNYCFWKVIFEINN